MKKINDDDIRKALEEASERITRFNDLDKSDFFASIINYSELSKKTNKKFNFSENKMKIVDADFGASIEDIDRELDKVANAIDKGIWRHVIAGHSCDIDWGIDDV